MKKNIEDLKVQIKGFVRERDWEQFHNAKDLALALSIEAAELNECFLWKSSEQANKEKIQEELADILIYAILLADKYNLDLCDVIAQKLEQNDKKYPVAKAKGNAKKYNEF
jgi:NTP pyrophosphatase (non-canonical NTP hydrolase)